MKRREAMKKIILLAALAIPTSALAWSEHDEMMSRLDRIEQQQRYDEVDNYVRRSEAERMRNRPQPYISQPLPQARPLSPRGYPIYFDDPNMQKGFERVIRDCRKYRPNCPL
jgi:hypothetical protein